MHHHFQKLKSNLELGDSLSSSISTRHNALRNYLESNHPNFKDSKLIGSLQRKTRIHPKKDGQIDIDILVIVGECHNWTNEGISTYHAMEGLHNTVNESSRYGDLNPEEDQPAITLTYSDNIQTELVPAYIDMVGIDPSGNDLGNKGRGYWVPKNGLWEMADYDYEAEYITQKNGSSSGKLVPTIKILKAIKNIHFQNLSSFALEILASDIIPSSVEIRKANNYSIFYPYLLLDFFSQAQEKIIHPLKIPGSKSAPIVLSQEDIKSLLDIFKKISQYITANINSPKGEQIKAWRTLCGDHFPLTIS